MPTATDSRFTGSNQPTAADAAAFEMIYQQIYPDVAAMYAQKGSVPAVMLGVKIEFGRITGVDAVIVPDEHFDQVAALRKRMLQDHPMTVFIVEAWGAPDASCMPSQHPDRFDAVSFHLATKQCQAIALCPVDVQQRQVTQVKLEYPDVLTGRMIDGPQGAH